jgi:hypothetical protein
MSSGYQIVVRKGRAYIRRRPFTYDKPTLRQEVNRGRFAKIAYDLFDQAKGYKDGLPVVAAAVKEKSKGKRLPQPPRLLEITPLQYAELLIQADNLRRRGVKTDLITILRDRNIRIKPLMPPEVKEIPVR